MTIYRSVELADLICDALAGTCEPWPDRLELIEQPSDDQVEADSAQGAS